MSIIGTRKTLQTISGDNGSNEILIKAIDGAVQEINIFQRADEHARDTDYLSLHHDNTLDSLIELRDMINQAINEARTRGIE